MATELAPPPGDGWQPISTAKTTGRVEWVEVWNGREVNLAHYACDLSGEEQPPFQGWFVEVGTHPHAYFSGVYPKPTHWRPAAASVPVQGEPNG